MISYVPKLKNVAGELPHFFSNIFPFTLLKFVWSRPATNENSTFNTIARFSMPRSGFVCTPQHDYSWLMHVQVGGPSMDGNKFKHHGETGSPPTSQQTDVINVCPPSIYIVYTCIHSDVSN